MLKCTNRTKPNQPKPKPRPDLFVELPDEVQRLLIEVVDGEALGVGFHRVLLHAIEPFVWKVNVHQLLELRLHALKVHHRHRHLLVQVPELPRVVACVVSEFWNFGSLEFWNFTMVRVFAELQNCRMVEC